MRDNKLSLAKDWLPICFIKFKDLLKPIDDNLTGNLEEGVFFYDIDKLNK